MPHEATTNFSSGELDPRLFGRSDIEQYYSGAAKARNVEPVLQGGLRRRPGLRFIDDITQRVAFDPATMNVRLIRFQFSVEQIYLFVLVEGHVFIYRDDVLVADLSLPTPGVKDLVGTWDNDEIMEVTWVHSLDTLILFHKDYPPKRIQRQGTDSDWLLDNWPFSNVPRHSFPDSVSGGVDHVTRLRLAGFVGGGTEDFSLIVDGVETRAITWFQVLQPDVAADIAQAIEELDIVSLDNVTCVNLADGLFEITFENNNGKRFWSVEIGKVTPATGRSGETIVATRGKPNGENAWSLQRGWPRCGAFFNNRFWLAGTRELPTTIFASWLNKFDDFSFDEEFLQDEMGIEQTLDSSESSEIHAIFPGSRLQFFTSAGEVYVPISDKDPITPNNMILTQPSSWGSKRFVPVVNFDGSTIFVHREGNSLRDFIFTDTEQTYVSRDITRLSSHLIRDPVTVDYRRAISSQETNTLYVVNSDGTLAQLASNRDSEFEAWTLQETDGDFIGVVVLDQETYFAVRRVVGGTTKVFVEKYDRTLHTDAAIGSTDVAEGTTQSHSISWLESQVVDIVGDNLVHERRTMPPTGPSVVVFDTPVNDSWEVGIPFPDVDPENPGVSVWIKLMPLARPDQQGAVGGRKRRISQAALELFETSAIQVQGYNIYFREFGNQLLDAPIPKFTGEKVIKGLLGWDLRGQLDITSDKPLDLFLLAVTLEVRKG